MITLINRLTGKELGSIPDSDLTVIRECLVEEDEWDTDYYLHESSLELLSAAGLSPDAQVILQTGLGDHTEIEVGWERASDCPGALLGKVEDRGGLAVGGCKIELHHGKRNEFWAFSREDGSFEVPIPSGQPGRVQIRISGLSDHIYWSGEVDVDPAVATDAGTFTVSPDAPPPEGELEAGLDRAEA